MRDDCPFCDLDEKQIVLKDKHAQAFFSFWPVSDYHLLITPKRHVEKENELTDEEVKAIHNLRMIITDVIKEKMGLGFYNVFLNQGAPSGKTIPHLHYHIIFRKDGDLENSPVANILKRIGSIDNTSEIKGLASQAYQLITDHTGGMRNIIAGMGNYKARPNLVPKREEDVFKWTKEIKEHLESK